MKRGRGGEGGGKRETEKGGGRARVGDRKMSNKGEGWGQDNECGVFLSIFLFKDSKNYMHLHH